MFLYIVPLHFSLQLENTYRAHKGVTESFDFNNIHNTFFEFWKDTQAIMLKLLTTRILSQNLDTYEVHQLVYW